MNIPRKLITISAVALIFASSLYGLKIAGIDIGRSITEGRCRSGAFVYHSDKAGGIGDDSDLQESQVKLNGQGAKVDTTAQPNVTGGNLIPNPGVELGSTTPTNWYTNVYDKNNAKFSEVNGRQGDRALRVEITEFTSGDADWYHNPVEVKPGGYYTYTDYYRSDVSTRAILMLRDGTGKMQYINLKKAEPSKDWAKYETMFFIPANVTSAMVFHPLASKGFLETDDFSMVQTQSEGFNRPLVSLTFDDGWNSIYKNAIPMLDRYGMDSTQYLVTGYIGTAKDYVTTENVYDMRSRGHEIASHTIEHADLTKESPAGLKLQVERSYQDLNKCFGDTKSIASPYGAYNASSIEVIEATYQTARSTDTGFNTRDNLNPYGLLVQNMTADTTEAELASWLETAEQHNTWLILVYHQIDGENSEYDRSPQEFENDLETIKGSGITVKTVSDAYAEVSGK